MLRKVSRGNLKTVQRRVSVGQNSGSEVLSTHFHSSGLSRSLTAPGVFELPPSVSVHVLAALLSWRVFEGRAIVLARRWGFQSKVIQRHGEGGADFIVRAMSLDIDVACVRFEESFTGHRSADSARPDEHLFPVTARLVSSLISSRLFNDRLDLSKTNSVSRTVPARITLRNTRSASP